MCTVLFSTFSHSVNKTFFFPFVSLLVCLSLSAPLMNQLEDCNWNGQFLLPSFVAFSSHSFSIPPAHVLLHLQSFHLYPSASVAHSCLHCWTIISLSPPLIFSLRVFSLTSPQARLKPVGQEPSRSTWSMWTTTHRCWYPRRPRCASVHAPTPRSTSQPLTLTLTPM